MTGMSSRRQSGPGSRTGFAKRIYKEVAREKRKSSRVSILSELYDSEFSTQRFQ